MALNAKTINQPIPLRLSSKPHEHEVLFGSNLRPAVEVSTKTLDQCESFILRTFDQELRNRLLGLTIDSEIVVVKGTLLSDREGNSFIIRADEFKVQKEVKSLRIPRKNDPNGRTVWRWNPFNLSA